MKTNIFLLLILLPFLSQATVWRVNGNEGVDADFHNLQEAVDEVLPGDTVYVEGWSGSYGLITVTQPVQIFGAGFVHSFNDSTQYNNLATLLDAIFFDTGSDGSSISGVQFLGETDFTAHPGIGSTLSNCSVIVNACCVTIESCLAFGGSFGKFIGLTFNADNCVISSCLYLGKRVIFEIINVVNHPQFAGAGANAVIVQNSVIGGIDADNSGGNESIASLMVDHCVITNIFPDLITDLNLSDAVNTNFSNNVITHNDNSLIGDETCTFNHNVSRSSSVGPGSNNLINVPLENLIDFSVPHPELRFSLVEGSPALTAAFDGGECGIFGSPNPYVLSGMPGIPSIFELNVATQGEGSTQSLDVNLKAKSHD
jgi:hypothetical protein